MSERKKLLTALRGDMLKAHVAALAAVEGMPDTGTCNFDSCFLPVHLGHPEVFKRKSTEVERAVNGRHLRSRWWHGYRVSGGSGAQGGPRTVYAETLAKNLEQWGATVYYQVD